MTSIGLRNFLQAYPTLEGLSLSSCTCVDNTVLIEAIAQLSNSKHLSFAFRTDVRPHVLRAFEQTLHSLRILDLRCPNVDGLGAFLSINRGLESVMLEIPFDSSFTDLVGSAFAKCECLTKLTLCGTELNDEDAVELVIKSISRNCQNLQFLTLLK